MRMRGQLGHVGLKKEKDCPMFKSVCTRKGVRVSALTALTIALLAGPVGAQTLISKGDFLTDPIEALGEEDAGRGRFFINSNQAVEVIRFKTSHALQMCAGRAHNTPTGRVQGYAIKVSWDDDTAVITPGNCLAFEAKSVTVRAASPLPDDVALEGAVKVLK
jgi:hypothetical protein